MKELARQKRWQEETSLAQELTVKSPSDPTPWYWLGVARLQLRDGVGAVQALRSAEKRGLDTSLLHEWLGLAYYDLNQFYLFEQQMEKASERDPLDAMPFFYRGRYREIVKGDFAGGVEFLRKAVRLRPDDPRSLYHLGNCLEQMQKKEEAQEYYDRAIRIVEKGNEAFSWPYRGMARLLQAEHPSEALHWAQKAVRIEPKEYSNHLLLAKILQRLGRLPEALREAQTAAKLNPTSSMARYLLFKLYREAGDQKTSHAELEIFEKLKGLYGPE